MLYVIKEFENVIFKIGASYSMHEFTTITIHFNICPLNIYNIANISLLRSTLESTACANISVHIFAYFKLITKGGINGSVRLSL